MNGIQYFFSAPTVMASAVPELKPTIVSDRQAQMGNL
jgi:hypothetical protein